MSYLLIKLQKNNDISYKFRYVNEYVNIVTKINKDDKLINI